MDTEQVGRPSEGSVGTATFHALVGQLAPDERVAIMVAALLRTSKDRFEEVAVVLTDRTVVVAHPDPVEGVRITSRLEREHCFILNHAERDDLSSLIVICHPYGVLCLLLKAHWHNEAAMIRKELAPEPFLSPTGLLSPRTHRLLRDVLEVHWRETASRPDLESVEVPVALQRAVGGVAPADLQVVDEVMAEFRDIGAVYGEGDQDDY